MVLSAVLIPSPRVLNRVDDEHALLVGCRGVELRLQLLDLGDVALHVRLVLELLAPGGDLVQRVVELLLMTSQSSGAETDRVRRGLKEVGIVVVRGLRATQVLGMAEAVAELIQVAGFDVDESRV